MSITGRWVGFFDRGGFDATSKTYLTWNNHAYNSILSGLIIRSGTVGGGIAWSDLQPTAGNPKGTGALAASQTAYIDAMFQQADNYNATNPVLSGTSTPLLWTLGLRIFGGESGPNWWKNLQGGPITISVAGSPTIGPWWTSDCINGFLNFMTTLAAYVPNYTVTTTNYGLALGANTQTLKGHPLLGFVAWAPTMTLYAETMMKDDVNGGYNLPSAGGVWTPAGNTLPIPYSLSADENALSGTYSSINSIWGTTPVGVSHNPYVEITGTGKSTHEPETESLMASLVSGSTWPYTEVENNSLRANGLVYPPNDGSNPSLYSDPHNADYTSMYTKMAGYGPSVAAHTALALGSVGSNPTPIHIQTSTYGGMGNTPAQLQATIAYAIWLGARSIELPNDNGGYTNLTLAQLAAYYPQIVANDPILPPTNTIPSLKRIRAFRHH